jgi:hypothetical protein
MATLPLVPRLSRVKLPLLIVTVPGLTTGQVCPEGEDGDTAAGLGGISGSPLSSALEIPVDEAFSHTFSHPVLTVRKGGLLSPMATNGVVVQVSHSGPRSLPLPRSHLLPLTEKAGSRSSLSEVILKRTEMLSIMGWGYLQR